MTDVEGQRLGSLFDASTRTDERYSDYSEPLYPFLNHSALPSADEVRHVVDSWFNNYPPNGRKDLAGRFRSRDDRQHLGAFTELFFHELMRRLGVEMALHPQLGRYNPDFFATKDEDRWYLECTLAGERDASTTHLNELLDAVNHVSSPHFMVGLKIGSAPKQNIGVGQVRHRLTQWLDGLDPSHVRRVFRENPDDVPRLKFVASGVTLEFDVVPRPRLADENHEGGRTLGSRVGPVCFYDPIRPLRKAIVKKARKYGRPDHALVIAVSARTPSSGHWAVTQALFGREMIMVGVRGRNSGSPTVVRSPDGSWQSGRGPRYARVSAVVVAEDLEPWEIGRAEVTVYENPWATHPVPAPLKRLPRLVPQDGVMTPVDGESAQSVLGIPAGWPRCRAVRE